MYFNSARLTTGYYEKFKEYGDTVFYKNNLVFPLLFAVTDMAEYHPDYRKGEFFTNREKMFENMFVEKADIEKLDEDNMFSLRPDLYKMIWFNDVQAVNCEIGGGRDDILDIRLINKPADKLLAETPEETGVVKFSYRVEKAGNYSTVLNADFAKNAVVSKMCGWYINGINIPILQMKNEYKDLGWFEEGDIIDLSYISYLDTTIERPSLYLLDDEAFAELSRKANENALENIRLEKGNIAAQSNFDRERLVFASIAYDKGLRLYIDGKESEYKDILDGFMGFYVPAGKHDILIDYVSTGAYSGLEISALFAAVSIVWVVLSKRRE